MTLPPRLAEMRDELAVARAIQIRQKYKADGIDTYTNAKRSFVKGFNSAYAIMLEEMKPLVEALEIYAMTNDTFPEYGDVARQALSKVKGEG